MESVVANVPLGPATLTATLIGIGVIIFVFFAKWFRQETEHTAENEKLVHNKRNSVVSSAVSTGKQKKDQGGTVSKQASKKKLTERESRRNARTGEKTFGHPWLLASLKGHGGRVLDMDFAANGKYLASCGDDRTVFLWDSKDFLQRDRKSLRVNVEFDFATHVKWSPDCKAFIIHRFNENALEVYKVEKKKDGFLTATKAHTFPKVHETDVVGMGIASNGKFMMTCSNKTDVVVWDLKGEILAKFDSYLMNNICAKISPCGRFIVASGFTPEAKVWEVAFNKSGEFKDVKQIVPLTLRGHSAGIYDVAFDVDSSHMATVSKDGTWKLFDTNVNYKQGQDARLLRTEKYDQSGNHALIALSPNSEVVVIATFGDLQFFSTLTGELDYVIENISNEAITAILFDASGKYLLVAADKQIRVFHNATGYRCSIASAKEKLKEHQTSATKERLQQLITDSEEFLKQIGEN
ncbi:transducin beta-like protein 2 isoform X2 [Cylas formicarius]|uniref:transducin beta-like protein 2 isoform X2 n=1 Tax=Cylas formicarius TaxID=197179 RepID=UPI00295846A8|nr:transducin beta-like protein 2 isoform X2 [Cylas formicarius]